MMRLVEWSNFCRVKCHVAKHKCLTFAVALCTMLAIYLNLASINDGKQRFESRGVGKPYTNDNRAIQHGHQEKSRDDGSPAASFSGEVAKHTRLQFTIQHDASKYRPHDNGSHRTLPEKTSSDEELENGNYTIMRYTSSRIVPLRDELPISTTKPFNVSKSLLRSIGYPARTKHMKPVSADNWDSFVFVTASSRNHFRESLNCIATVQQYFSSYTLYFYDLDESISPSAVRQVRQLCNVVYRTFNFSRYPPHVRDLHTFAFKPIIVHELLLDHAGVFWIDSSVRFEKSSLNSMRQQVLSESRGVLMFEYSIHSIFQATHRNMYDYLPISKTTAVDATMMSANAIYIRCSADLYKSVFRWWLLCALDVHCLAPTRNISCHFKGRDEYADCHRFDQAALNILLANYFDGEPSKYSAKYYDFVYFARDDTKNNLVCMTTSNRTSLKVNTTSFT